ncbi:MAG: tetratricopeptide repeat protein [Bosea sp. (in: a-proteobacteria)]|uniref:tetratricopeptide repeat protein n=1 Tax=Bosea sp. (in: a-proteobacteria) TaxID=1871050 RepID=UPI0027343047|nr:tetratricopeptide repeat protein [Bosea sp. (in: a-proteobacteria)]MDP3258773.1 tetratricopeptide repeat protein [Bosea sp. (in: a-proteobacteria)]MDP3317898.1 tetratricopeptide repeat protein [Bosea sp. (in: a-proteobacteria)]
MACSFTRIASCAGLVASVAALGFLASPALAQKAETVTLCRAEKTERAIAACTAIIKGRGDRKAKASALLSRAQAYWALNRLAEAEKDYSETIVLAPKAMALYRDRGQIRFGLGNNAGAMADFTTAIEMAPFDADNYANRGYLKMLQYDFSGAGADLRQGLFWQKDHARSAYMVGLLHYSTGRYGDAVEQIDKARAAGFRGPEAFITKARSLYYLGTFDPAIREATEGLQAFPTQSSLTEIRARARLVRRDLEGALADVETVIQAAPRYGRAYATRGAIRLAMKDVAAATADADKAIELDPLLFDAHELKAEILLTSGNESAARAVLAASAARTDAKLAYDIASRARHASLVVELDKPKPILVTDLDEAELKTRCDRRDDPLRFQSCDRLVETATTPQERADRLILRSRARPFAEQLGDLDLALAAAPDHLSATIARAYGHMAAYRYDADLRPYERAWADADSAVRLASPGSPEHEQALLTRATAAEGKGDYEAAILDLTQILNRDGTAPYALEMRGKMHLMAGRAAAALADLREIRRVAPEDSRRFLDDDLFVIALIENGETNEALAALDGRPQGHLGNEMTRRALRARALLARGEAAAAREVASAALTTNRAHSGASAVRGIASAQLGNALEAVADLTAAIDETVAVPFKAASMGITPGHMANLFLHRGLARVQLNQSRAAHADFSEAIRRMPDRARPYGERARLSLATDNPAALTDIAMALRIEPNEPRWQALAARINLATGDLGAAERFAGLALAAPAPEADLLLLRAKARLGLGNFGGAVEDATVHLAARTTDTEALLIRIEARSGQGDLKAALADAEAARKARSDDARILLALAELRRRSGDAPGAIGAFEDAAGRPDAALLANKRLGDLYAEIASDQLALGYYAKALEQPVRTPTDEALRSQARAARDALIRKMAAPK